MIKLKSLVFVLLISCPLTFFAYSQTPDSLEVLIKQALENNPQIAAFYNDYKAAEYKVRVLKSLPDPTIHYTYFQENTQTRTGPQERKYGASQKIPFPGKLHLKGKAQLKQAKILKEQYEEAKRLIVKKVKFTFYDIFWTDKAIEITEEEKAILESLEKVVQRKYESNRTPQQDVIKAQVELSRLIDKLYLLKQSRSSLVAKLNSILNRKTDTEVKRIEYIDEKEFTYSLDDLKIKLNSSSEQISAANLNIERAQHEKSLAKMGYLPDFTFGFSRVEIGGGTSAHSDDGQDALMGTVALTIPLWFDKVRAGVQEKKASLESAKKNFENTENNLIYEVEDTFYKIITYKDIISLYKTALLPQTKQAYQAAKTSYETGKVDFLNWLDAERILLQTRLAYYKAIIDYQKSFAYLERIIGKDL
tara:strand:+ start:173 stop:1429 length:1257 start_codon:yes stop_codon:yes gene_type:complete